MWKRFYVKAFEAFVGLFVIVNGLLTLWPGSLSTVRDNLWNLLGYPGFAIPVFQIIAGLAKIIGIGANKSNIESAGLIMVGSIFFIRSISLVADGDITAADINNLTIALGIICSNIIRLTQIMNSHKYLVDALVVAQNQK